jgi:hypothetical protein
MPEWHVLNSAISCRTKSRPTLSDRSNPDFHTLMLAVFEHCPRLFSKIKSKQRHGRVVNTGGCHDCPPHEPRARVRRAISHKLIRPGRVSAWLRGEAGNGIILCLSA